MSLAFAKINVQLWIKFWWIQNSFFYQTTFKKLLLYGLFVFYYKFWEKTQISTVMDRFFSNGPQGILVMDHAWFNLDSNKKIDVQLSSWIKKIVFHLFIRYLFIFSIQLLKIIQHFLYYNFLVRGTLTLWFRRINI